MKGSRRREEEQEGKGGAEEQRSRGDTKKSQKAKTY